MTFGVSPFMPLGVSSGSGGGGAAASEYDGLANHRYWRVFFGKSRISSYPAIWELEFYSDATTKEDLSAATTSQNWDIQSGTEADIYDGVLTGAGSAIVLDMDSSGTDFDFWLDVDFGSAVDFHHLRLSADTQQGTNTIGLFYSDDGITYTLRAAWGYTLPASTTTWFTLNDPFVAGIANDAYEWLGLFCTENNGGGTQQRAMVISEAVLQYQDTEIMSFNVQADAYYQSTGSGMNETDDNGTTTGGWGSYTHGRTGIRWAELVAWDCSAGATESLNGFDYIKYWAQTAGPSSTPTRFWPVAGNGDPTDNTGTDPLVMRRIGPEQSTTAFTSNESKEFTWTIIP